MAKIWIDVLTPKQVLLFSELAPKLEARGHETFLTTRRYREVSGLLALKKLEAAEIGEHGGGTLEGKLLASAERVSKLTEEVIKRKPDIALSYCSPEAARVAFGLGVPHVCVSDSPHAEAVCRLTIPLSTKLVAPKIIPLKAWYKFGVTRRMIMRYNALDPVAWISSLKPDLSVLDELGLDPQKPIITFRPEESFAAYLLPLAEELRIAKVIEALIDELGNSAQYVALPRYTKQAYTLKSLSEKLIVPEAVVDGFSLLTYSSLFVGAGGTMTAEAALLGVPTISCYPGKPTFVERYLARKGLVLRAIRADEIRGKVVKMLRKLDEVRDAQRERAERLMAGMENPVDVICKSLESLLSFGRVGR